MTNPTNSTKPAATAFERELAQAREFARLIAQMTPAQLKQAAIEARKIVGQQ